MAEDFVVCGGIGGLGIAICLIRLLMVERCPAGGKTLTLGFDCDWVKLGIVQRTYPSLVNVVKSDVLLDGGKGGGKGSGRPCC
jgi:hypothetical protein